MHELINRFEQYKFMRSLFGGLFVKLTGTVLLTGVDRWFSADQISYSEHFDAYFQVHLSATCTFKIFKSNSEVLAVQLFA